MTKKYEIGGTKEMNKPTMLNEFMYALMKEARRDSLWEFIEEWGISKEDYEEIEKWFKVNYDIKL